MPIPGMTGGEQKPIIKYNAKAAKWKVDDVLLNSVSFIIDMDNIEAGWCKFTEGSAPDFKMVKVAELLNGANFPESPGENYRKGFRATVKVSDKVAGGKPSVREFASNSFVTKRAFDGLFDQWFAQRADHPDQLPVVQVKNYEEIAGKHGANFAPLFTLIKWVDRPADMQTVSAHVTEVPDAPEVIVDLGDLEDEIPF
jgi:hypothetical protein